ncbi:hypothetical protein DUI87_24345 [Hirundo rustica rustica]|uniref:ribonuclease H n=1 Tax=Hirundo rustica rustica TaxID=333673 RepID=A0A3M0JDT0_HIRRU|nr:hypothetical protein DUI87_24345 [Hirundo rustica rustica]
MERKIWTPEEIIKTYGPATWAQDGFWGYCTPIYMLNRIIRLQAVLEMNSTVEVARRTLLELSAEVCTSAQAGVLSGCQFDDWVWLWTLPLEHVQGMERWSCQHGYIPERGTLGLCHSCALGQSGQKSCVWPGMAGNVQGLVAGGGLKTWRGLGYRISQKKAQMVKQTVIYLGYERFLKYQAIMVEQDDVEIVVTNTVNPASFLSGSMGEPVIHECLEAIKATCSSCLDLKDTLLENTETWSTDGSSAVSSVEGMLAAAGTSAPHAPAGSAGCAAPTASSSAQNAPAQEESPALDLGLEIEKMIREIRNSLPVKAPSAQAWDTTPGVHFLLIPGLHRVQVVSSCDLSNGESMDLTETNLLGRDLQVQLGVGVIPKDGKMVVHIMKLTQGDIQEINPEVWATEGKYGCLDIPPIKIEMQKDTPAIRVKQYPMSPEGKKGLASVIEHLLKENILEPCMSPHNTPILAIKKDEGKFRLVQDLREINKRTIARHPVVPNPYTLLSKIPREHTWFTVIDLKDAFWACPLAEECRDWFAFEWEHPDRGRKQQLRWTRLPQGYTESPNIFGQALETLLEQFSPTEGVQILQYVDDLLISGETEKEVKNVSIQLLNFFGEKGLKVSQSKLQFVETEVTYLGHIIGKGSKKLSPARISGIVSISPPKTKRDVRKLLGLFGYCKHWIDKYTQGVKFLYDKLIDQEPMNWTESDEKQLQDLKEKLSSAPVLSLPDLKKEFDLFVNTEKGIAYGVLTQEWGGGYRKPVAFLSKLLDPVARGWPACLQAVAAAAILIEEAQKLTLQGKIKIHTPHDLKTILSQRAQKWLTDSRILKYEIILINTDNLELTTSKSLNPAQFLSGEPTEEIEHHCLELIDMQTKVREDLEDTPFHMGEYCSQMGHPEWWKGKEHPDTLWLRERKWKS